MFHLRLVLLAAILTGSALFAQNAVVSGSILDPSGASIPKAKVAVTLDAALLDRLDHLVSQRRFRNRSQAVEAALAEKLERLARTRLARECAKLDPDEEQQAAEEGLDATGELWPEY